MLRLTLAQMRRSLGRLAAAGIAIVIGTAFVAATLLAAGLLTRTTYDAVAASYADTDLVVTGAPIDEDVLADVDGLAGIAAAEGVHESYRRFEVGSRMAYLPETPVPSDPRLQAQELTAGRLPADGEVALPEGAAERLGVSVGEAVTTITSSWQPADIPDGAGGSGADPGMPGQGEGEWVDRREELLVSGVVSDPAGAFAQSGGAAMVTPADARRWYAIDTDDAPLAYERLLVVLEPGQGVEDARAAIADLVTPDNSELVVRTKDEQAAVLTEEFSGEANLLTGFVLGFAAIALIVASLVIANTFAVLVAERTRGLALLRCVGASRRQLRRSVTLEALMLGVVASVIGIVVGVGLAQGTLSVLNRASFGVPLPETVALTPAVVIVPLVAGVLVTWLAALTPARAAGRVSPLAALRPALTPSVQERASRSRLVLSGLLVVGGLVLLGLGVLASGELDILIGLLIGILGGLLSFTGVLVGAVFWIPRMIGLAGTLVARFAGPASKLAAANTVRNPRRTAATSSALLIGVTLVAMMSTGAASARQSLDNELDRTYPVDVAVDALDPASAGEGGSTAFGPSLVAEVGDVSGVAQVAELTGAPLVLTSGDTGLHAQGTGIEPGQAATLLRDPELVDGLVDGTVLVPADLAELVAISDGDTVTLNGASPEGEPLDGPGAEVTTVVSDLAGGTLLLTGATLAEVVPDAPVSSLWVRLAEARDTPTVVADIQDVFSETAVEVVGAAVERARYEQVIDTLLAVVVGLLGVAVIIALVGVANTLSLSVLERRRESATLRAIGLTRRQLRQTLAVEGVLIAGSGAVLGAVLGTLYGWAGTRTVLGSVADGVSLAIPWRDLGLVLVVAVAAGLVASVLPGRRAARTSPVAALAVE